MVEHRSHSAGLEYNASAGWKLRKLGRDIRRRRRHLRLVDDSAFMRLVANPANGGIISRDGADRFGQLTARVLNVRSRTLEIRPKSFARRAEVFLRLSQFPLRRFDLTLSGRLVGRPFRFKGARCGPADSLDARSAISATELAPRSGRHHIEIAAIQTDAIKATSPTRKAQSATKSCHSL